MTDGRSVTIIFGSRKWSTPKKLSGSGSGDIMCFVSMLVACFSLRTRSSRRKLSRRHVFRFKESLQIDFHTILLSAHTHTWKPRKKARYVPILCVFLREYWISTESWRIARLLGSWVKSSCIIYIKSHEICAATTTLVAGPTT